MRTLVLTMLVAVGISGSLPSRAEEGAWGEEIEESDARVVDPKKEADIRKLIAATGEVALARQAMAQMRVSLQQLVPETPDSFWDEFMDEVKDEELIALLVPIYDRHLSHEDVKALLAFYTSPAGRRVIKALPSIAAESMKAGETWGQQIAMRVMRRVQQREHAAKDE